MPILARDLEIRSACWSMIFFSVEQPTHKYVPVMSWCVAPFSSVLPPSASSSPSNAKPHRSEIIIYEHLPHTATALACSIPISPRFSKSSIMSSWKPLCILMDAEPMPPHLLKSYLFRIVFTYGTSNCQHTSVPFCLSCVFEVGNAQGPSHEICPKIKRHSNRKLMVLLVLWLYS